jgi:hypothetical protein
MSIVPENLVSKLTITQMEKIQKVCPKVCQDPMWASKLFYKKK